MSKNFLQSFTKDFSLDGLVKAYSSIEIAKANAASARYENQAEDQEQTLGTPEYTSGTEAISGGNAVVPTGQAQRVAGIPNGALYGGGLILGTLLVAKLVL